MRLTKRKRKIIELLACNDPPGVGLLNELRLKCVDSVPGEEKGRLSDRRKSLNRTILDNFDEIQTLWLAENHKGFRSDLRVGLFARWAVWELLEHRYLSSWPEPEELVIAVGRDACTAIARLSGGQLAVVATAVFMGDIVLVSDRAIQKDDLDRLSQIPWRVLGFTKEGAACHPDTFVDDLLKLQPRVNLSNGVEVSTAKKRFRIY
ncbi:hypothetical protein [Rhizobium ruizarguesonis]|uniref:hypothetical protein n=1 Tax=Rhizobium ruizarguesonis TaxID=2081791 RepID=UPI00102F7239|nr:hypothetical protein [Rhizobium ruizarguesonis]TBA24677.1 hypothetical protein ELH61_02180 [Rhizobium ruizarguesonis]